MSLLASCQHPEAPVAASAPQDHSSKILRDVPYGKDSFQRMDAYLPEGRSITATKALILIHGGGWNSGSKSDFASYIDSFRRRMPGYALFNINYRLFNGGHLFPTQEEDVKAAVDFIAAHAADYAVNKDRFVLLGASAGGHLALLQAYKHSDPRIRAVIDFFGPSDLTAMYEHPWHQMVTYALEMITGTTPSATPDLYRSSSPVNFITADAAPTLIFHGDRDQVVDISQSKALAKRLKEAGVVHELVVYPGQRHGWSGATLSNSFDRIATFLKTNVND